MDIRIKAFGIIGFHGYKGLDLPVPSPCLYTKVGRMAENGVEFPFVVAPSNTGLNSIPQENEEKRPFLKKLLPNKLNKFILISYKLF